MRSTPIPSICRPPCWCRTRANSPARSLGALDNSDYFDIVASRAQPGRARRADRARRGPVRDHHPRRLHPPRGPPRQAADPGRGRRLRPGRDRRRRRRARRASATGADARPQGPARPPRAAARRRSRWSSSAATIRKASPPTTSSPACSAIDPVDDAGDDDRARRDPRGRARDDGDPARHAGAADRGDDRQAHALRAGRDDPGDA